MPIDFNSMVGGEADQNVQSVGFLLAKFFVRGQEMFLGGCDMPAARAFFTNMSVPMPLGKKLKLLFPNNFTELRRRQNCCDHPGEPRCCEGSSDKPHLYG